MKHSRILAKVKWKLSDLIRMVANLPLNQRSAIAMLLHENSIGWFNNKYLEIPSVAVQRCSKSNVHFSGCFLNHFLFIGYNFFDKINGSRKCFFILK